MAHFSKMVCCWSNSEYEKMFLLQTTRQKLSVFVYFENWAQGCPKKYTMVCHRKMANTKNVSLKDTTLGKISIFVFQKLSTGVSKHTVVHLYKMVHH